MESTLRRHLGDGEQNCDWSVVYVFVAAVAAVLSAAGASWGLAVLCRRRHGLASTSTSGHRHAKRSSSAAAKAMRYTLLAGRDEAEEEVLQMTHQRQHRQQHRQLEGHRQLLLDSDSDEEETDSEVWYLNCNI